MLRVALCLWLGVALPFSAGSEPPPPVEQLPPLPLTQLVPSLSFSNPFSKYAQGVIPGWQYGGALCPERISHALADVSAPSNGAFRRVAGSASLANDYITLTPPAPNTLGWIWSNQPVSDMSSWEVDLEFHIGGADARGAGGGLAFWFTEGQGRSGPIYGQDDNYNGLGIFFDTYDGSEQDENPEPFVVAMMNYGSALAAGDDPDYFKNQVGVCFAGYRNLNHPAR